MQTSAKNLVIMVGLLMLCGLLTPARAPAGDTVYIADVLTIGLRQSPDPKSTIIKALQSDVALEILEEQDKYRRVRTQAGDEGWIPEQHISAQPPKSQTIAALKTELAAQKTKAQSSPVADLQGHGQIPGRGHGRSPLTATSANLAGAPPCTSAVEVQGAFANHLGAILDGGPTPGGPPFHGPGLYQRWGSAGPGRGRALGRGAESAGRKSLLHLISLAINLRTA